MWKCQYPEGEGEMECRQKGGKREKMEYLNKGKDKLPRNKERLRLKGLIKCQTENIKRKTHPDSLQGNLGT